MKKIVVTTALLAGILAQAGGFRVALQGVKQLAPERYPTLKSSLPHVGHFWSSVFLRSAANHRKLKRDGPYSESCLGKGIQYGKKT